MDSPRKPQYIPLRVGYIKDLLKDNDLSLLVDFDNNAPESYLNVYNQRDIRYVLNKKTFDFNKIMTQIGGKLKYIKSGTTGHTFKGLSNNESVKDNYAVKIVAYPKKANYGNVYDIRRPENAEIMMLRILSYFVLTKQTPHIVLPVGTFNTSIKPFLTLSEKQYVNSKKYDDFLKKYKKGEYHSNVSVLISEWANGGDLLEYIRKNYKQMKTLDWKVLIFQIVSTLATIQVKYPSFRHNDLKANNILVHYIPKKDGKKNLFKYDVNGNKYGLPNIGFQIKIWDFDFACIPGIVDNLKVSADWTNKINVKPEMNKYYDIHYFFSTLTKKGFFPQFWTEPEIPEKIKAFVKRILPNKYISGKYISERGRILINDEYTTPSKLLLEDPLFNKFRPKADRV
jgi:serine/threonine protein kinase